MEIVDLLSGLGSAPQIDKGDIAYILNQGLGKLTRLLAIDQGELWLMNDAKSALNCIFTLNDDKSVQPRTINKAQYPQLFTPELNEQVIVAANLAKHPLFTQHKAIFNLFFTLTSAIFVPIVVQGQRLGFLCLGHSREQIDWQPSHVYVAQNLAQIVSRALFAQKHLAREQDHALHLSDEVEQVARVGSWQFNVKTAELYWSDETYKIHGLCPSQQITLKIALGFYCPAQQKLLKDCFINAIKHHKPYAVELNFVDNHGVTKWVKNTGKIRTHQGKITHIYGALKDISARKKLLLDKNSVNDNLTSVVDNLHDTLITLDHLGIIKSANKVTEQTFGYKPEQLIGKNISVLMPEPFASRHNKYMASYQKSGSAKIIGQVREFPALKKDGSTFPMELTISEIMHEQQRYYIGIIRDITQRKAAEQALHQRAYYDKLTGLLNRVSFERDLAKHYHNLTMINGNITLALIDIDNFSQVNFIYGEQAADKLLAQFAQKIIDYSPPYASVYRSLGDSFYILFNHASDVDKLPSQKHLSLRSSVIKLLEGLRKPIQLNDNVHKVKPRIAVIDSPVSQLPLSDIKPLLDLTRLKAKQGGGDQFLIASSLEHKMLKRQTALMQEMIKEDFTNELFLVLQPQYDPKKVMLGAEALVRWSSPKLGVVGPDEFISLAEQSEKIIEIGDWVIEEACRQAQQRRITTKQRWPISVNISAKQIAQPNFSSKLINTLDKYGVPHNELCLELTETTLVADFNLIRKKMLYLNQQGFKFSLDDFGTGYSSLSYIRHLPMSELKIDKFFVDDIVQIDQQVPIINTIIQMAKSLNLTVVAEGVETKVQLEYLTNRGCDVIQGYLFSKPLSTKHWLEQVQSIDSPCLPNAVLQSV